jgi:septal ring factor EnvC (AmiA/AmiB activator)
VDDDHGFAHPVRKLIFALAFCTLPLAARAAGPKEIGAKTRSLEKVKNEISERQREKAQLRKEASEISDFIKNTNSRVETLESSLVYTKQKTVEIEQKLAVTKNENDRIAAGAERQRQDLIGQMHALQIAMLLEPPQTPSIVAGRLIAAAQADKLDQTLHRKAETGANLKTLVDSQEIVRREYEKQQDRLRATKQGREQQSRLLHKKLSRQEALDDELKDLQKTAERLTSFIDDLRAEAKEQQETTRQTRQQNQRMGKSPIARKSLPWPFHGKMVTRFGRQQHPTLGTVFISNGIELTNQEAQPALAVADGTVLYAGQFMSYGSMVVVEHPGDWYSVYAHLQSWECEKGQHLKQGDRIGMMRPRVGGGYEGYFELRFYGKSVDPIPWLN